jgi:hypothetical protein
LNEIDFQDPSASFFRGDNLQSTSLDITMSIGQTDQRLRFNLEENTDLALRHTSVQYLNIHGRSREAYQSPNSYPLLTKGSVTIQNSLNESWADVGWARIAVIEQGESPLFDGIFTINSTTYEIQLERNDQQPTKMVAYRNERPAALDGQPSPFSTCASQPNNSTNSKRQEWDAWGDYDLVENIGNTDGCPSSRQIVYIGVATDCAYSAGFNSTDDAHRHILNVINTASVVFENSFNISIGVQNITISDAECPESISGTADWNAACSEGDLNWRLERFSSWRSSINDNNAYWTLFSGCPASSGEVGVSWIGALCNSGSVYSSSAGTNVVARTQLDWRVFA